MKTKSRGGFAMLVVVVTVLVLIIMWASAYREVFSAIAVENARRDRSLHVDGSLVASARALEKLEANAVPIGSSEFRTLVSTATGTYAYKVSYTLHDNDLGPPAYPTNMASCAISVSVVIAGVDDLLPPL